jgi:hypothetical protein
MFLGSSRLGSHARQPGDPSAEFILSKVEGLRTGAGAAFAVDLSMLHSTLSRGSRMSRSPSPNRLMDSTKIRMAIPGRVDTHQAVIK